MKKSAVRAVSGFRFDSMGHLLGIGLLLMMLISIPAKIGYAAQSTIIDAEAYACMGDDKSRKQTEQQAMAEAKRNAADKALTYIKSETQVKDMAVEKDLINAYTNAAIKIIAEIDKSWYKDAASGDCYRVKIKADVTPDEKAMQKIAGAKNVVDDPSVPLNVQVWTEKKAYHQGEKVKAYLKGNKPFYARVIYKDTNGNMTQVLPNPYRKDNYFNGGVIYELPSGNDSFELEVSPPFGQEGIVVYASTTQLGDVSLEARGVVYSVKTPWKDMDIKSRGVHVLQKGSGKGVAAAEFAQEESTIVTTK